MHEPAMVLRYTHVHILYKKMGHMMIMESGWLQSIRSYGGVAAPEPRWATCSLPGLNSCDPAAATLTAWHPDASGINESTLYSLPPPSHHHTAPSRSITVLTPLHHSLLTAFKIEALVWVSFWRALKYRRFIRRVGSNARRQSKNINMKHKNSY